MFALFSLAGDYPETDKGSSRKAVPRHFEGFPKFHDGKSSLKVDLLLLVELSRGYTQVEIHQSQGAQNAAHKVAMTLSSFRI